MSYSTWLHRISVEKGPTFKYEVRVAGVMRLVKWNE